MKPMITHRTPFPTLAALLLATVSVVPAQAAERIERGEMAGYLLGPIVTRQAAKN